MIRLSAFSTFVFLQITGSFGQNGNIPVVQQPIVSSGSALSGTNLNLASNQIGCVSCSSDTSGPCGLRSTVGQTPPQNLQRACAVGIDYCFTLVRAQPGFQPYIRRGCGPISCNSLPGEGGAGQICDEQNNVIPIQPPEAFNQSRIFNNGNQNAVLQLCRGSLCNAGLIADYSMPGYFVLQSSASAIYSSILSLSTMLILFVLLKN
ncbi:hypothetical protein RvY_06311 [Ramazzottius varieornatus]|uniref:Uncharacterized protein n=1 Tax=Ramazzottius varieornatus TaxID=947166 RepID=A0A1D1V3L7_RAMVA|nr:hypothetical protein RvY_06311 [Ramazzottius varieornatus]